MKKTLLLLFLSVISWSAYSQTFSTSNIDSGDFCANVFNCMAKSPVTDEAYGFWRDGSGATGVYKLIKWNGSSWASVGSFSISDVNTAISLDESNDAVSLAIDNSGNYHVAFKASKAGSCCNQERGIVYGYSTNGTSWSFTKIQTSVDPSGWLNYYDPQIKIDKYGYPNIVFRWDNANPNRSWTLRHFVNNGSWSGDTIYSQPGTSCQCNEINDFSFDIDTNATVHVAFQSETDGTGRDGGLWYVSGTPGSWGTPIELIHGDTLLVEGYANNIAIGPDNKVYIISSNGGDTLKETTNKTGSWVTSAINGYVPGYGNIGSFSINSSGDKYLVYYAPGDSVKYALQTSGTGAWRIDTISTNYHNIGNYQSGIITNSRKLYALFDVAPATSCSGTSRQLWAGNATMSGSCTAPTVPTVTGGSRCPSGSSVSLGISGTLNDASKWYIYTGSCGGTLIDSTSSSSYSVSPSSTTTYYIRGEGNCVTPGSCGSATVTVNTESSITSVTAGTSTICVGTADTLTANGVTTGTGATLTWYTGTGGTGTNLGTSNPLYHTPSGTTTYYARLAGTCNTVESSTTVTVNTESSITSVTASASTICFGTADTLTANGVTTGTGATLTWYTGTGGTGTNLGTSNPLYHTPSGTTTYYARLSGTCNTVEANATVTVNTLSSIGSVTAYQNTICPGVADTLTANSVTVGTGATLTWYTGTGGTGTNLGTGNPLVDIPSGATTYYARLDGTCNTVEASTSVNLYNNTVVNSQSSSQALCENLNTYFAMSASGSSITKQWQVNTGGGYSDLGGETNDTLYLTGVTVSMNGNLYRCMVSGTCNMDSSTAVVLTVYDLPVITNLTSSRNPVTHGYTPYECADLTVTATGGNGSYSYGWTPSGTGNPLNVCPTIGTWYTVTVTDVNNCTDTMSIKQSVMEATSPYPGRVLICYQYPRRPNYYTLNVLPTQVSYYMGLGATLGACGAVPSKRSGSDFAELEGLYKVYPNPFSNELNLEFFNMFTEEVNITLTDMTGRVVKTIYNGMVYEGELSRMNVDATDLSNGMYLVRYSSNSDVRINKIQLMR